MFTGLVQVLGQVVESRSEEIGWRLTIQWPGLEEPLIVGESVAVNGCCLTVLQAHGDKFEASAGPETLAKTNLSLKHEGAFVNLQALSACG